MKKYYKYKYIMWILFVIVGILQLILNKWDSQSAAMFINIWIIVLLITLIRHYRFWNKVIQDELSKKIAYTSLAASFQITLFAILVIWWIDYFYHLKLTLNQFISYLFLFMFFVAFVFKYYYTKRIDKLL